MTAKITYTGSLRTEATHIESGNKIITDAPKDNEGKGEAFSPTDLVATATGSCMVSIMGILARRNGWNIDGSKVEVTKIMASDPRRIAEIQLKLLLPASLEEKGRKMLEHAARTCPVIISLNNSIKKTIEFSYQ